MDNKPLVKYIAFGVAIGCTIGVLLHDIGLLISFCTAICAGVGSVVEELNSKKK